MLPFPVSRKITFQSVMSGFIIWMDDFWSKDVTFFEFDIDWLKQTRNPALTWLGKLIFLGFYWTAGFIMDRKKLLNLQGLRFCEIKECVLDWKSWQDFVDWWADYNVIFGLTVSCELWIPISWMMRWKYWDHSCWYQMNLDSGEASKASRSDRTRSDSCDKTPVPWDF